MTWSGLTIPQLFGLGIAAGVCTLLVLSGVVWCVSFFREMAAGILP